MRRTILSALALTAIVSMSAMAQTIVGSKHDLSTGGGITNKSTTQAQVCIFCHTPHQTTVTAKPLWNHTLSSVASYGVYSSTTLNATPTDIGGGTGVSNLCMSCHDGTVAVNNLGNGSATMGSGTELNTAGKLIVDTLGTSLTQDHPINFTYDATLATNDGGLKTPSSASYVDAAHNVPLYGATVQCASCHNPHNNTNGDFVRVSNSGSALCLTCHNK